MSSRKTRDSSRLRFVRSRLNLEKKQNNQTREGRASRQKPKQRSFKKWLDLNNEQDEHGQQPGESNHIVINLIDVRDKKHTLRGSNYPFYIEGGFHILDKPLPYIAIIDKQYNSRLVVRHKEIVYQDSKTSPEEQLSKNQSTQLQPITDLLYRLCPRGEYGAILSDGFSVNTLKRDSSSNFYSYEATNCFGDKYYKRAYLSSDEFEIIEKDIAGLTQDILNN